ncbi:NAD(P)-dependent oxidoreductase [Haematococcus lacustris]|uniref:NAD(P)-dependent oxidoreductase n=1 Tax=Haematococcus lacustris TaxID=44745 RepID=A0A699Z428_HAELA|nr:NAD(P)-dependent oxidoreductase [Haematococcus lacustris]
MYGQLDILINNAAEQHYRHSIADITDEQLERTFATNIFGMFYMTKAALPHLKPGSSIVNTTSVTSYQGQPELLDYSSTKGCITAFTRSLSQQLADKGKHPGECRGPGSDLDTPHPRHLPKAKWQTSAPLGAGQPSEVATCFVFLASEDGSYYTGQVLHPNGGMPVNS